MDVQATDLDGWIIGLVELVKQDHGVYRLSFELAYVMEDEDDEQPTLTGAPNGNYSPTRDGFDAPLEESIR